MRVIITDELDIIIQSDQIPNINSKIELIIIKFIVKSPLKPSIKFDPLIINKKHKSTKNDEKNLFSNKKFKKVKSIF